MASTKKSALYWTCTPDLDITKPTIIFLHAAWMSSTMFDETMNPLSTLLPNTNLLCVDLNGHGKTMAGRKKFTLWEQGDDIVALMDELKIQRAIFAGISMGACIAMRTALSHPSRTSALILMASTAEASAVVAQMRDVWVSTPEPSAAIMDLAIQSWGGNPDVNGPRAQRVKSDWIARHSGAENVDPVLQSVDEREHLLPRLREISVPVLLVHGEKDETWKLDGALRIRDAIGEARSEIYVVKDSGHLVVHMRDSEDVSRVIARFVERVLTQNS